MMECPHCGSDDTEPDGQCRYICNCCSRTFVPGLSRRAFLAAFGLLPAVRQDPPPRPRITFLGLLEANANELDQGGYSYITIRPETGQPFTVSGPATQDVVAFLASRIGRVIGGWFVES